MAVVEPVTVLLNGKVAGTLHTDRVTHAEFAYADRYLDDRSAVPLSMSLPFQEEPFRSTATSRRGAPQVPLHRLGRFSGTGRGQPGQRLRPSG